MSGAWHWDTDCNFSWILPATRTSRSAPRKRWASLCRRTSRDRFNPLIHRSSGRAGTCRCRSGFATTFSCRWPSLRREVWWRNLALVISMVLFGLWHQASVLFCSGVAITECCWSSSSSAAGRRKFDWEPPATFWTPLSWVATMALINLGWIFFRANSLPQARHMLAAVVSPASYLSHFLSGSLYLLGTVTK